MYKLLAHGAEYHTNNTSGWAHALTEPLTMNILFVFGVMLLAWTLEQELHASQTTRIVVFGCYTLAVAGLSYRYNQALAIVCWSLAILCLVALILNKIYPHAPLKKPQKKD